MIMLSFFSPCFKGRGRQSYFVLHSSDQSANNLVAGLLWWEQPWQSSRPQGVYALVRQTDSKSVSRKTNTNVNMKINTEANI